MKTEGEAQQQQQQHALLGAFVTVHQNKDRRHKGGAYVRQVSFQ